MNITGFLRLHLTSKERIFSLSLLIGTAFALLFGGISAFAEQCEQLPERLFRLHILANSDSEQDQQLKYDLRDYLLEDFDEIFESCTSAAQAKLAAADALPEIAAKAQQFVLERGADYTVTASVERVYFTTRSYGGFVAPAGEYEALRIVIGSGEGKNWWCVMFPPLCVGAAEDYIFEDVPLPLFQIKAKSAQRARFSLAQSRKIESTRPQVKFAIFEWLTALTS